MAVGSLGPGSGSLGPGSGSCFYVDSLGHLRSRPHLDRGLLDTCLVV